MKRATDENLRWMVQFAVTPVSEHSRGNRRLAALRIERLIQSARDGVYAVPDAAVREISDEELERLRTDIAQVLSAVAHRGTSATGSYMPRIAVEKLIQVPPKGGRPVLFVTGPVRDVVLEVVYHWLLVERGTDRIRQCPGCEKLFLRTGKQTYCTTGCYDRHYWTNIDPKTLERYRRKQYEPMGWTRGARRSRLPPIATDSKTRGSKRAQVPSRSTKNARKSPRGKIRA